VTAEGRPPTEPRAVEAPLRVGYLHLGRADSGVRRYGRIIAEVASRRIDLEVVQADAGPRGSSWRDLRAAARELRGVDVLHLQWKPADWGGGLRALVRLEVVLDTCQRPTVVTLHDVYPRSGIRERVLDPGAIALRRLRGRRAWLVVHAAEERSRLTGLAAEARLAIVPHFAEERTLPMGRDEAKAALGFADRRVITLVGHMTKRKNHQLVLEALRLLPHDVHAVFVGAPIEGREVRAEELRAYATQLGVADRVRFTGFVPEEELGRYLAATDVAACPYRDLSASGALATWISTGRPIVTSDLPAIRELDQLSPGALRTFSPLTAEAFAERVGALLDSGPLEVDPAVDRLRRLLATPHAVERYLDVYRSATRHRASGPQKG
jgi:glycosyltransferase involved in cell wall biosynthesis